MVVKAANTVGNLATFYRRHQSRLFGSDNDIPIFAQQNRIHSRTGIIGSITHQLRGHTIKTGIEASRIAPREFFTFFITDEDEAVAREIGPAVRRFDDDKPFVFRDRRVRSQFSVYAQDAFSPIRNLTVQAGLRYDHSNLLVSELQFSPRIPVSAVRTTARL